MADQIEALMKASKTLKNAANEWDVEWVEIERLTPYARNPRKNEQTVEALKNSIQEFGFLVPLMVDKDYVLVTGHTRVKAALLLGWTHLPVVKADDLTKKEVDAFRLIDNKISEISEWDFDMLADQLEELRTEFDKPMEAFGFKEYMDAPVDDLFDPDNQAKPKGEGDGEKKPKIVKGICPCCGQEFEVEVSKDDITDEDVTPSKVLD